MEMQCSYEHFLYIHYKHFLLSNRSASNNAPTKIHSYWNADNTTLQSAIKELKLHVNLWLSYWYILLQLYIRKWCFHWCIFTVEEGMPIQETIHTSQNALVSDWNHLYLQKLSLVTYEIQYCALVMTLKMLIDVTRNENCIFTCQSLLNQGYWINVNNWYTSL